MDNLHDSLEHGQQIALAENSLRYFEKKYFDGVEPVYAIEIVNDPTLSSQYLIETHVIQINSGVARFPRLVRFLILHELAHHKLVMQNPAYSATPYGEPFNREIQDLLRRGAYEGLL